MVRIIDYKQRQNAEKAKEGVITTQEEPIKTTSDKTTAPAVSGENRASDAKEN